MVEGKFQGQGIPQTVRRLIGTWDGYNLEL